MLSGNNLIKSAWIAVELDHETCERVLVVETYIAVSPLEKDYDALRYQKVVEDVRRVMTENPDIDRASILSMHRNSTCTALFRKAKTPIEAPAKTSAKASVETPVAAATAA